MEIGKPKYFDIDHYLDSVEQMICADEIVNALKMIDMLPAFYRENVPQKATLIKERVFAQLMTVSDYAAGEEWTNERYKQVFECEPKDLYKHAHFYPRGPLLVELIKKINADGYCANIVELGAENYWIPHALNALDTNYVYYNFGINDKTKDPSPKGKSLPEKYKTIFCCFEVIEHLWNIDDIYHYYCKIHNDYPADFVMISTPQGVLDGGLENWHSRDLGHIRTFTKKELSEFGQKHWPKMSWQITNTAMMVLIGERG